MDQIREGNRMASKRLHTVAIACIFLGAAALVADIVLTAKDMKTGLWMLGVFYLTLGSVLELIRSEFKRIDDKLDQKKS